MDIAGFTAARALAFVLATLPATAAAGLYKCELDSGIMYQQTPCPPGRELRDFERNPATVSVVPFRVAPENESRKAAPVHPQRTPRKAKSTDGADASAQAAGARGKATGARDKGAASRAKAAERKFLIPGIYQGEVLAKVGNPDLRSGSSRKTMRWTYLPAPEDPSTVTTLTFREGRLIEVERKVVHTR